MEWGGGGWSVVAVEMSRKWFGLPRDTPGGQAGMMNSPCNGSNEIRSGSG